MQPFPFELKEDGKGSAALTSSSMDLKWTFSKVGARSMSAEWNASALDAMFRPLRLSERSHCVRLSERLRPEPQQESVKSESRMRLRVSQE